MKDYANNLDDHVSYASVAKPLSIIFKDCTDTGTFSDVWKRSNIPSFPFAYFGEKFVETITLIL